MTDVTTPGATETDATGTDRFGTDHGPCAEPGLDPGARDPVLEEVGFAIELASRGDRAGARLRFAALWERIGPRGDALHRCAVAHCLADVQDDPTQELAWDLLALDAARQLGDERHGADLIGPAASLFPSLHLNLADVYLRLGDLERAALHLLDGRAATARLRSDGYRQLIDDGLDAVAERLDAGRSALRRARSGAPPVLRR